MLTLSLFACVYSLSASSLDMLLKLPTSDQARNVNNGKIDFLRPAPSDS